MRVRITRALKGSIDGIQLSRLEEGHVYDVNTSLACYLLSEQMAEPASDEKSASARRIDTDATGRSAETRKAPVLPRSIAADRRHINRRKLRKKHT